MKTLPSLLVCLVLSVGTAGQALAQNLALPVSGLNKVLQMKVDEDIRKTLGSELYIRRLQEEALSAPGNKHPIEEPGTFTAPDCLCYLYTRVF